MMEACALLIINKMSQFFYPRPSFFIECIDTENRQHKSARTFTNCNFGYQKEKS